MIKNFRPTKSNTKLHEHSLALFKINAIIQKMTDPFLKSMGVFVNELKKFSAKIFHLGIRLEDIIRNRLKLAMT